MGDTYAVLGGVSTRLFIKILVVLRIWYVPHRTIHRPTDRKYIMSQQNFDPNQPNYNYNPNMQQGMGQQPYEQEAPDARSMATFAHISPVLSLFAPLIFWFIYKDKTGYGRTKAAAARAFNLALTWTIVAIVYIIVCAVIFGAGAAASTSRNVSPLVGIASLMYLLIIPAGLVVLIFHIVAAVKTNKGEDYKYPVPTLKVLKDK